MTAKNEAAVKKIVEQVRAELLRRAERGVARACDDIVVRAQSKAPVSHERLRKIDQGQPVSLRPLAGVRKSKAKDTLTTLHGLTPRARTAAAQRNPKFTRFFQFSSGPDKGQSPTEFRFGRRGGIRGVKSHETGGTLRDSIHVMGIEVTEDRVSGHVGSKLPYAGPMEYGFKHFSHGKNTGKVRTTPYLRPAGKEVGERIADYFRE